jgi:hypothetical protein
MMDEEREAIEEARKKAELKEKEKSKDPLQTGGLGDAEAVSPSDLLSAIKLKTAIIQGERSKQIISGQSIKFKFMSCRDCYLLVLLIIG